MAKFKKLSKPGSSMIFTFNIMVHLGRFLKGIFKKPRNRQQAPLSSSNRKRRWHLPWGRKSKVDSTSRNNGILTANKY